MSTHGVVAPKQPSGFLALPVTRLGKWSAWLLVISIALILVNNVAVIPATEQASGLDAVQSVVNLTVFLCAAAAGITGLLAMIMKHEHSWAVYVAVMLLLFALAMNLVELLPG